MIVVMQIRMNEKTKEMAKISAIRKKMSLQEYIIYLIEKGS